MCDCVSSTPLTYNSARLRKSREVWCDSKLKICRIELPRTFDTKIRFNPPNVCSSDHTTISNSVSRSMNSTKVSRNQASLGSNSYEFFDELGFKGEGEKGFEFETRRKDVRLQKDGSNSTMEDGIGLNNGEKEVVQGSDSTVSSSFDFLELKVDLENEKRREDSLGNSEGEDLIQIEGSSRVSSKSEDSGQFIARSGLRIRRQVIRRSNMLAKQVISVQSALSLGFISQLWVDTSSIQITAVLWAAPHTEVMELSAKTLQELWVVDVVEVRPSLLSGEIERFLLEDIFQVGDVVLVKDESVMENEFKMAGLQTLVGYNVETPGRRSIGKVRGYTFNINSGVVESLELDSFGISIIPSSLVSTYALCVEDVLEVASDTVVVHEAAASCIQRLTKGFWDTQNKGTSKDEVGEYSDMERVPVRSDHRRNRPRSHGSRKFRPKIRETEDDWELPMDYL